MYLKTQVFITKPIHLIYKTMDIFINKNIMGKIIRLTENDLARIVKGVIMEGSPILKTIVYTDPRLTKTLSNIDIVLQSMILVSRNVKFTYSVAGRPGRFYSGIFYCSTNNQVKLGDSKNISFISSKRAVTLKSKCGVNQGYASTNTGVDTTLA